MKLSWTTTGKSQYRIPYDLEMDGGGTTFGQDFVEVIKERWPNQTFNQAYEWCSGPGFIGYNLLDHGICKSICFSDIYWPAIDCARQVANNYGLQKQVSTYLLEDLALLPRQQMFDLVVANPPHFNTSIHDEYHRNRIVLDQDWKIHRDFFQNIKSHLTKNGTILLQETLSGSTVETFREMIDSAGLRVKDWYISKNFFSSARKSFIYYIEISHS